MAISTFIKLAVAALAVTGVSAHPKFSNSELVEYQEHVSRSTEALGRCLEQPHMKELHARMAKHRAAVAQHLHEKRGADMADEVVPRGLKDMLEWEKHQHEHPGQSTDPQSMFDFKWNDPSDRPVAGCALSPEAILGPYWLEGQPQRQDVRAGQRGVYMRLGMQVVDVETCHPLPGAQVYIWSANSAGQYSRTNTSWLRGWQPSSVFGTVDFDTNFPGHYPGRSTHMHVAVREPGHNLVHAGMLYFDEPVRAKIEATAEYQKNKAPIVLNKDDGIAPYSSSEEYDPFVQWSWLGKSPEDGGILAWIAMGINRTAQIGQTKRRSLLDDHLEH